MGKIHNHFGELIITKLTKDLEHFDFIQLEKDAIKKLKSGQPLTGKDGVMTALIKQILEAALEGEMESHLSE